MDDYTWIVEYCIVLITRGHIFTTARINPVTYMYGM